MLANFPAVAPSEHSTITAGRFPHVAKRSTGGRSGRIRLGNAQLDAEIQLAFTHIDTDTLLQLKGHWGQARGTTRDFALPATLFPSMNPTTRARLIATAWRFKEPPTVVDICGGAPGFLLHTVEITLRSQPRRVLSPVLQDAPELSLPVVPRTGPGARFAVTTTWAGGRAGINVINAPGAQLAIRVSFEPGRSAALSSANAPGATWTVTSAWESVGRTTPPAAWNATVAFAAGRAGVEGSAPGAALNASASFDGGRASVPPQVVPGAALAVTATWATGAGSITGGTAPGAAFNVGVAWVAGIAQGIGPGAALNVTAAWVGGAASSGSDPNFFSVPLLLPFEGANNSTTFTDASSNALTPSSVTGDVKISTAQFKYGNASALFTPGSNGAFIRYTPQTLLEFSADFTIEAWIYSTTTSDQVVCSSASDWNTQIFRLNESGAAGNLSFYLNGTQVFNSTPAGLAINTHQHLAICRSGSSTRMFVNGFQIGPTNTTWTGTFRMDVIGTFFLNGSRYFQIPYDFTGHIDELRLTKAARYTANFTPPSGPFPTS